MICTVDDLARRLSAREVTELCALLRGRVSWRGERALAAELGIDVRDLRAVIRRVPMSPRLVTRIRLRLVARGLEAGTVVMLDGGRAAA